MVVAGNDENNVDFVVDEDVLHRHHVGRRGRFARKRLEEIFHELVLSLPINT